MHLGRAAPFTIALATTIAITIALVSALGCGTAPVPEIGGGAAPAVESPLNPPAGAGPSAPTPTEDAGDRDAEGPGAPDAGQDAAVATAPFEILGRVDTRDPAGPRFGWPGTTLRARFIGTGLSVVLADSGESHYDVSIDGASPSVLVVTGAAKTYDVAQGLAPGAHDITLTKRTETSFGVTRLEGFLPAPGGAIIPIPLSTGRRIEIIGDSITCGYGVLGSDATCAFTAETESEPRAWGAIAARALSAVHSATAVSGIGVLRNYGGETTDTMPDRYDRALADDPASTWDHSFVPDVVVVNLGTNDFAGGKGDPGPDFEARYAAFLAKIRGTHPAAHIVAATSPMLSEPNRTTLRAYVEAAIAARAAAGDANLSLLDIDEHVATDGYGCHHHPSEITQQKMAARLVAHVKARMGW